MLFRMALGSKSGVPDGAKVLCHFNNTLKNEITGQNIESINQPDYAPLFSSTIKKFGTHSIEFQPSSSHHVRYLNAITINGDFTISVWCYLHSGGNSVYPIFGNVVVASDYSNGRYLCGISTVGQSFNFVNTNIKIGQWQYIKIGRKGTELFCIIDGIKSSITGNANPIVYQSGMESGQYLNDTAKFNIDEFIFIDGFGDDSLEVPTKEWGV